MTPTKRYFDSEFIMLGYLVLGIAGALGTISRYLLGGWIHQLFGPSFPYGTLLINVSGSLAIGFLGTLAEEKSLFSPQLRTIIFIGFLGAFTTFSSFTYETWELFKNSEIWSAVANVGLTFCGCFAGLLIGVLAGRWL